MDRIDRSVTNALSWAIDALEDAVGRLALGEKAEKEVRPLIADLRRAQLLAMKERQNLDEERRKRGELVPGEIDFDAARSQILDHLARLRAARGPE
ncbi:hypothetical protein [Celeribacter neptunius]|uniref:hypothetical protein n=1 Tax=Celeribacter neptunius TaxID=588602 RepID=UPI0011600F95|nr:hypothetical protein [Celeribacter neptunius]